MEEPTKEWAERVNRDMAECVLDHIKTTLEAIGVPRSTFTDDQFNNFVAMYNNRGQILHSQAMEIDALRNRIMDMEHVLAEIANWANPEDHVQMRAMKVWAASVVDPAKVNMLGGLTTP